MSKYQYYNSGSVHPYAHRLRLKPTTSYIQSFAPERSLTVTNLRITPRTAFEMERPQTGSTPHVVVINTSFRSSLPDRSPRKHVPTFPKLATEPQPNRQTNISRLTNSSNATVRKTSAQSSFRRNIGSATRYSARRSAQDRENSSRSDRRPVYLTQRQSNTFAAYAKYNDIVQSTKAKERASESPITSNINDLSALIPEKKQLLTRDLVLSNEKHVWISDWVAKTSAAMRLDNVVQDDSKVSKTLSVIDEQT